MPLNVFGTNLKLDLYSDYLLTRYSKLNCF